MGPPPDRRGRSGPQESHEAKLERISKRVQQLPTEDFMDREEIEALPLFLLKVIIRTYIIAHCLDLAGMKCFPSCIGYSKGRMLLANRCLNPET